MKTAQRVEPTLSNLFIFLTQEAESKFPALAIEEEKQRLCLYCPPTKTPPHRRKNEPAPSRIPLLLRTEINNFFENHCGCDKPDQRQTESWRYRWLNDRVYALDLTFDGDSLVISLNSFS